MGKDISAPFFKYRDCCRQVWNNFFIGLNEFDGTGRDIYDHFQDITDRLFNALIAGQIYNKLLERTLQGYYDEIIIEPNLGPLGFEAMWAGPVGPDYKWEIVQLKSQNNDFRFMEFFDWTIENTMECQYVRARLLASDEFPALIGNDFLLEAWNVKYYKKEK